MAGVPAPPPDPVGVPAPPPDLAGIGDEAAPDLDGQIAAVAEL
ncbi:MAG: sugar phosphate isomerase/epimerase, partial [Nonomuraea sp.]|nr:sugar phosphate isomerase/epimerase [Nonomuraea sp.]